MNERYLAISKKNLASHFYDYFERWYRYEVLFGGRGGSKSTHIAIKYLARLLQDEYCHVVYCRKWSAHIRDSQFQLFKNSAELLGWSNEFKFNNSDYTITAKRNGNHAIAKGLDNADKTKSIAEPTHIWVEEADQIAFDDFDTLNKSLRSPRTQNAFTLSFNTFIPENHWIRETIFDKNDIYQLSEQFKGKTYLNHSTYLNNPFINQDEYKETLLMNNGGNEAKINSDLKGEWGQEPNNNPFLYAFDENKHTTETIPIIPSYPIYLSFDFNKDPLTCVVIQMSHQKGNKDSFIHFIDEFALNCILEELCQKIYAKYYKHIIFVTGDSSGNREGEVGFGSKHDSVYSLIQKHLALAKKQIEPNNFNLTHENSRYLINSMFHNYPIILISKKCFQLINDIKIARIDENANTPHQLLKDRGLYKMDLFDAMRYFFQKYFQEFARSNYYDLDKK